MQLRRVALGLLAAGAVLGIFGVVPDAPHGIWRIGAMIAMFGTVLILPTLPGRRVAGESGPTFPIPPPLKPGEVYDTAVKLTTFPNVPLAELWVQRLKEQGIEAFHKPEPSLALGYAGVAELNPGLPAEVWVGKHDAERAAQLLRELG